MYRKINKFYFIYLFLLLSMIFLGFKAYENALAYENATKELAKNHDLKSQTKESLNILSSLLFNSNKNFEKVQEKLEKIEEKQKKSMKEAQNFTLYFMIAFLSLLIISTLQSYRAITLIGSIGAMITLVFGLITPILMVTISQDINFLGEVILSFESKGIIGSIETLWNENNYIVAGVIFLFSVINPTLKVIILSIFSIFKENFLFKNKIIWFFKMISKWSMLDVFVVAIFLVYLTTQNSDNTKADIEVGLYFFLSFVIVSMIITITLKKW